MGPHPEVLGDVGPGRGRVLAAAHRTWCHLCLPIPRRRLLDSPASPQSPLLLGHTRRAPASRPAPLQRPPPGAPSAQTSTWLRPHRRPPSAPAAPPCSPPWCPARSRPPLETGRVTCPALPTELGVKLALARGPRQSSARLLALPRFAFSPRDTCTVFLPTCPHRRAQGCAPRDSPLRSELLTDRALSVPDGRRPGGRTANA